MISFMIKNSQIGIRSYYLLKRWLIFAIEAWVELAFFKAQTYDLLVVGGEFRGVMPISEPDIAANHRLENKTYFIQALYHTVHFSHFITIFIHLPGVVL